MTKVDPQKSIEAATILLLIAAIVLPFAIGLMYGAGVGWLTFGLLLVAAAYRLVQVAKKEEKKQEEEVEEVENARYGG